MKHNPRTCKKPASECLMEALNRIDELACESDTVRNNDNQEAQQLEKDYRLLADFIDDSGKDGVCVACRGKNPEGCTYC